MPSIMHSSLASYGVGHCLLEFGVVEIGSLVQLLARMSCLRQLRLAQSNSDGKLNSSSTSSGSKVIDRIHYQTSTASYRGICSSGEGIGSIHPSSTVNTSDVDSIPRVYRQQR